MTYEEIKKQIESHMSIVGQERDKLDEFIETLQELRDSCSRAYDNLYDARDAMSELV